MKLIEYQKVYSLQYAHFMNVKKIYVLFKTRVGVLIRMNNYVIILIRMNN